MILCSFLQLNSLVDHLVCPVCRGTLHNTVLTLCGHRYCRHCIYEWVGRRYYHLYILCYIYIYIGQFYQP